MMVHVNLKPLYNKGTINLDCSKLSCYIMEVSLHSFHRIQMCNYVNMAIQSSLMCMHAVRVCASLCMHTCVQPDK